jgi:RluA family pseudouridine synthase
VEPYDFTFESFAKGRWIGKDIYHVFVSEFRDRSNAYYAKAIDEGRITVSGQLVKRDYKVKHGDIIQHSVHRHEPPVLNRKIKIIQKDDKLLIVDKPPSLPVHPTGRYCHNTLVNILKYEHGYDQLHPINRIDRLTSGIVILALDKETAIAKCKEMASRNISKTYLCKVKGEFPEEEIKCVQPLAVFAHKLGINHVSKDGKESTTLFKKISSDGFTSLVEAKPLTGRTHQIRVHLQWLGYPIANDPLYGCKDIWGDDLGKGDLDRDTLERITELLALKLQTDPKDDQETEADVALCFDCANQRSYPQEDELLIWLHSSRYQGTDWSFESESPDWIFESR